MTDCRAILPVAAELITQEWVEIGRATQVLWKLVLAEVVLAPVSI